jgi:hypothetical protein
VLTHLDLDHSGGLPDFPSARVHPHDAEYRTAMAVASGHPEHALRYRPAHWEHRPLRLGSLARLRELVRDHADEVGVFSAHDPWRYAELSSGAGR